MEKASREPVDYRYDAINPTFLNWMARIGAYADDKYKSWSQYTKSRLTGKDSPTNHIQEHLRSYIMGEDYDHFDKDVRWHLVAIAYNAMMEFFYYTKFGPIEHPLVIVTEKYAAPAPILFPASLMLELNIPCPSCKAGPAQFCTSEFGESKNKFHASRTSDWNRREKETT